MRIPGRPYVPLRDGEVRISSWRFRQWSRRDPVLHERCFCCEAHELPEHRAHRIAIGYHPSRPWPGRLAPGEFA